MPATSLRVAVRLVIHRKLRGALPLRRLVTLRGCSIGAPLSRLSLSLPSPSSIGIALSGTRLDAEIGSKAGPVRLLGELRLQICRSIVSVGGSFAVVAPKRRAGLVDLLKCNYDV